jgi:hypothetical protein
MQRYTHLKTLERKIIETGEKINQHHKKFVRARTGSNTSAWNAPNKAGFTKANYEAFVRKAIQLQYNKYDPLIRRYMAASHQYRKELGLDPIKLGPNWVTNNKTYRTTATKDDQHAVTYANLNTLLGKKTGIYLPGKSSGTNGNLVWISLSLHKKKFYPNVKLLNALRPARMAAAHRMAEAQSRKSLAFRLSGIKEHRRIITKNLLSLAARRFKELPRRPLKKTQTRARSASPRKLVTQPRIKPATPIEVNLKTALSYLKNPRPLRQIDRARARSASPRVRL